MKWDSNQYMKFGNERTRPSAELAAQIKLAAPKTVIDLGCGPGNSTENLLNRFPEADILGVDSSDDMLESAREKYKGTSLHFEQMNISPDMTVDKCYDVVFSNACLQWIPDHERLIPKVFDMVNDGGVMAIQLPLSHRLVIYDIVRELENNEKWKGCFEGVEKIKTLEPEVYFDMLSDLTDDFNVWETVYYHRMKTYDDIIEWYKGTGLRPYFRVLSEDKQAEFCEDILSRLREELPMQKNGEVIYKFPRLFFTAYKHGE